MNGINHETSELHRLMVMIAAEPNLRSLAARIEGDADLLREAVVLYAGLQQPGSPTVRRLKQLCQVYDISFSQLVRGLKGIVAGSSLESDAAFREITQQADAGSVFEGVDGGDGQWGGLAEGGRGPAFRGRWFRIASVAGAALLLVVALKAGGAFDAQPVRSDTTRDHVVTSAALEPGSAPRREAIPKKTGSHWIRLAMAAQQSNDAVLSSQPAPARTENSNYDPSLITDVAPLLRRVSRSRAAESSPRLKPTTGKPSVPKAIAGTASLLTSRRPQVTSGEKSKRPPARSSSPKTEAARKKPQPGRRAAAHSGKKPHRSAALNRKKTARASPSGKDYARPSKTSRKTVLLARNDKAQSDANKSGPTAEGQEQGAPVEAGSLQAMTMRLERFLDRYTRAFSSKNLNRFLSFFDPAALENGRPVSELIGQYEANFNRTQWIRYAITMRGWRIDGSKIRLEGVFHLKTKFKGKDDKIAASAGNIVLTLEPVAGGFRVVRLDYTFWR